MEKGFVYLFFKVGLDTFYLSSPRMLTGGTLETSCFGFFCLFVVLLQKSLFSFLHFFFTLSFNFFKVISSVMSFHLTNAFFSCFLFCFLFVFFCILNPMTCVSARFRFNSVAFKCYKNSQLHFDTSFSSTYHLSLSMHWSSSLTLTQNWLQHMDLNCFRYFLLSLSFINYVLGQKYIARRMSDNFRLHCIVCSVLKVLPYSYEIIPNKSRWVSFHARKDLVCLHPFEIRSI